MSVAKTHRPVWCIFLRSLPVGGVERQFTTLVNRLAEKRRVLLVTLFNTNLSASILVSSNVETVSLFDLEDPGKTSPHALVTAPRKLSELLKRESVDVVYSARDLANLIAAFACRKDSEIRLLWGHRSSAHKFSMRIRVLHPLCRLVQNRVHCQIANSSDGIDFYRSLGLCKGSALVIPNFVDAEVFSPDETVREHQRKAWALEDTEFAIGIVGRIAPMKNHEGFLKMASAISDQFTNARFLIIGPMSDESKIWLEQRIKHYGMSDRVRLLPAHPMNQMAQVYNALDILCSPSLYGEGFGNVIAEAMACGCPVIATDVGEARNMLAGLLPVVQPGDDETYQKAVLDLIANPPTNLSSRLRARIVELCDPDRILSGILEIGESGLNYPSQSSPASPQQ